MNLNPFWSMSTNTSRKHRSENEEQGGHGDHRGSPARLAFGKKQLPAIPKNAVPITKPSSATTPVQSTNGTHASYGPFYLEYSLLAEFTLVIKQKLPGIYVQPSYKSALMWFDNYPDGECPKLVFDIPVFHPLVDPISGELDVRRAFTKWRRNHNHIWQVLMYARTIFYKINTTEPLNPEAAVLYEKDVQLFKSKVVESVKLCNSHLFDQPKIDDPYAISFSPWNPAVHEEAKERMFAYKRRPEEQHKGTQVAGLSWVKPGSTQPFSKEDSSSQS
ncbi:hypothetical protein WMY93_013700 [Mugilogobius chulae]|uniref:UBC core domain-containing protein n=1 Tax=Mugilogobius chulae TaxID=88201 RepID=A0AAW0P461_9GOBI